MASEEKITAAVFGLSEVFGRKVSKDGFKLYARALRDVPDEALAIGSEAVLRSQREFMPTPGQFRTVCLLHGETPESRALAAWGVASEATRYGGRQTVDFADKAINATIRLVARSWPEFNRRIRSDEANWLRKEFLEAYQQCLSDHTEHAESLKGTEAMDQSEWTRDRYGIPPTLLIPSPYREFGAALPAPTVPRIELKRV